MATDGTNVQRFLAIGRSLFTERDPELVLQRVLREAQDLTGARYVALGVLNERRTELDRFLTLGIDAADRGRIGDLPHGRGVLGVLIERPQPLRLRDVGSHPQSYGFPLEHPAMETFLGVPILIRGEVWGNLYLTDKWGGEPFSDEDETIATILAELAAAAIENAREYSRSEQRRLELEQAVGGLEAARDIAEAIGSAIDLDRILELIVKRGRALVGARSLLVLLRDGDEFVVAASAGHASGAPGRRIPLAGSTFGDALTRRRAERIENVDARLGIKAEVLGISGARTGLIVPIHHQGVGLGVLAAFDRGDAAEPFTERDEELLRTFVASAGNAVAISRNVEADRLRSTIAAADAERARWARELHDQTLQALAALRVGLSAALRIDDRTTYIDATRQAITDIESEIANLRAIIADLRPLLLDDVGLRAALDALLARRRDDGLAISCVVDLPAADGEGALERELETTIYRLVQEALTNVVKHARATHVAVSVAVGPDTAVVDVRDDGLGFDTTSPRSGFGLAGMRERVFLLGGTLTLSSTAEGTLVHASMPRRAGRTGSVAEQIVS